MLTTLAAGLAVPLLLILWSSGGQLRRSPWPAAAVLLWYGYGLLHGAIGNVHAPREWDYACFWLYGHIAAAHLNIYDPAVFAQFSSPFTPSDEFRQAVLNVGFPYPPPTIMLFLPLGFIAGVPAGLTLWYIAQFAALVGAAWVLARTFAPGEGWRGAVLILAIVAALPASLLNVDNAQTNFIVLLFVALALAGRGTAAGAIWETLALFVKPYAAVLLVLDAVRGRWQRLLVAVATAAIGVLAAAGLLGPTVLTSSLHANPAAREPAWAFTEAVNQSLLAIVLRLHANLPPHISALHEPLYLAGALVMAALTVVLSARKAADAEVAFAAMLLLGLIVYPGALSSYGVVLIVPLLVVWRNRAAFPGGASGVAAIAALAVILQSGLLQRGFEANTIMWLACVYLLRRSARRAPRETSAAPNQTPSREFAAGVAG